MAGAPNERVLVACVRPRAALVQPATLRHGGGGHGIGTETRLGKRLSCHRFLNSF